MEGTQGITPELYRAVIALVDDRLKEIRVTREDFDRLTQAVTQLAQAQARTEQRVEELAQAQARTEQRLEELAQAQARTDAAVQQLAARVDQLAQAQARTEQALQQLATQVGALSENVGYGLEDIARVVLPGYLKHRYGVKIERLERRILAVDGQRFDIDLYAEGLRGRRRVVVLGEVKSRIYAREVHQFQQLLEAVQPHLPAEPLPLMFGYFIDLSATEAAREKILLIAAYQPTLEGISPSRRRR
jgi:multidrug efflux pump subunit AcrA (membrane-fusion protein)